MEHESAGSSVRRVRAARSFRSLRLRLLVAAALGIAHTAAADGLDHVRSTGRLVWGADAEGGGPYVYPDPADPRRRVGFEVELIALLCGELGPSPVLEQCQWDELLMLLGTGRIDVVLNGYELTPARRARYLATRPYYVYQLQLLVPKGSPIGSWDAVVHPGAARRRTRIAVLGGSSAEVFLREHGGPVVSVLAFTGATDAMMAVTNGQADATLQDVPAARFYARDYPGLVAAGPPVGHGYYVMYLREEDGRLRDALDRGIDRVVRSGELRRLYEKYGIWSDAQAELASLASAGSSLDGHAAQEDGHGIGLLTRYGPTLLGASGMTVFLSCVSMPLAMVIGLFVALGREFGPPFVRGPLSFYVEVLRGTPLMLQLFVLFFLMPELGLALHPVVAGVAGLAINYSAYEAEIYRAGLQAVPEGQLEAALALGMTRRTALRRIVVPQAVRIVIPSVTNDFIALFKDTSVCSVIAVNELTKQYSILAQGTGAVVEFAAATALLYLLMSLPLSWLSRRAEERLDPRLAARRGAASGTTRRWFGLDLWFTRPRPRGAS